MWRSIPKVQQTSLFWACGTCWSNTDGGIIPLPTRTDKSLSLSIHGGFPSNLLDSAVVVYPIWFECLCSRSSKLNEWKLRSTPSPPPPFEWLACFMVNSDRTNMLRHALERPLLGLNMYAAIYRIASFITTLFTEQVEQSTTRIKLAFLHQINWFPSCGTRNYIYDLKEEHIIDL